MAESEERIQVRGAREHNLRNINLDLARDRLIVLTGLSGSGKSSLAFDTLYAEGQRRYMESLSAYARQFLDQLQRPDVDLVEGLPPAISLDHGEITPNPRSTVATVTEVSDYLRLLFARIGTPFCSQCGRPIHQQTAEQITAATINQVEGQRVLILAPLVRGRKGQHPEVFERLRKAGFVRARVDGQVYDLDAVPELNRNQPHQIEAVVDRLAIRGGIRPRLAESIHLALKHGGHEVIVSRETATGWDDRVYSTIYACTACAISYSEMTPRMFSFNSPYGACPRCGGLGFDLEFDPDLVLPDRSRSLAGGAILPWRDRPRAAQAARDAALRRFAERHGVSLETPVAELPAQVVEQLLYGDPDAGPAGDGRATPWPGVLPSLRRQLETATGPRTREELASFQGEVVCPECQGTRLRPEARAVRIGGKAIHEVMALAIDAAADYFTGLELPGDKALIAHGVIREIRGRLRFLNKVGLGYLTLDRRADTLSGGEMQRVRLATHIGSGLIGVCYILDEPTIGLHQRDNDRLIGSLRDLQAQGNTVIVVEHDEATIRAADYVVDLGPGAGAQGGEIVAQGSPEELIATGAGLTAQFLRGERAVALPRTRRPLAPGGWLTVRGARAHNLQDLDIALPLGNFIGVTGVSGSGKSTLVGDVLCRAIHRRLDHTGPRPGAHAAIEGVERIDKLIEIDQAPIGRTPRSTPATYTGLWDEIRRIFAQTREARIRGYKTSRFSYNLKGGRCETCEGQGVRRIAMHFLPDLDVTCEACQGRRFNRSTLEVRYRGKSIADVLALRVSEAVEFFANFPRPLRLLETLRAVGLGYITLGQSSTTLSSGEAQRVKLAAELSRVATGRTLYILDEPTTGLHFADIVNLLEVLHRLTDLGNTVLVIEHNLDVIRTADWIIDLGPEGGAGGGRLIVAGPPERVAACPASFTGRYLRATEHAPIDPRE